MCGIVGTISLDFLDINKLLKSIHHRGPDSMGYYKGQNKEKSKKIFLGHKRLSILDLSSNGNQPFYSQNKNYILVYNGEIYNYKELKKKYLSNVKFKSNSDTEVILELFKKLGEDSFNLLNGMFSFAIYDKIKSKLYLVRDHLGIKPLYYYFDKNNLYFSSEIKSFKYIKNIDLSICNDSITEFFLNGFLYEPNTGFRKILKVFPGSFIKVEINKDLSLTQKKIWKPEINKKNNIDFIKSIRDEYEKHLVSDVPLGLFFSGGIDSSLLLSLDKNEINSYFIDGEQNIESNEDYIFAKKISKSLNKKFNLLKIDSNKKNPNALLNSIEEVAIGSEELIADYTFFVSQKISKESRNHNNVVMLSGMGADELFLGYPRYKLVAYEYFYRLLYYLSNFFLKKNKSFAKKYDRLVGYFENKSFIMRYTNLIGFFNEKEFNNLFIKFDSNTLHTYKKKLNKILKNYRNLSNIQKVKILDLYGFLSHNFMVADKSSMQHSIEMRVPLATKNLFEICFNSKRKDLMNFFEQKKPLLKILKEKLPISLFKRSKKGFNPNLDKMINSIGYNKINEIFSKSNYLKNFNKQYLNDILLDHFNGKKNNSNKIYQILYFNFWLKNNS